MELKNLGRSVRTCEGAAPEEENPGHAGRVGDGEGLHQEALLVLVQLTCVEALDTARHLPLRRLVAEHQVQAQHTQPLPGSVLQEKDQDLKGNRVRITNNWSVLQEVQSERQVCLFCRKNTKI